MKKIKQIAVILVFWGLVLPLNLFGQTTLFGTINSHTTLSKANSPYIISNTLTINSGVELTIEAGCQIKVADNTEIQVNGDLIALGSESDSIYFTSQNNAGLWNGITANSANISFYFVKFNNSKKIFATNYGTFIIENSVFENIRGTDGMAFHYAKSVQIDHCKLKGTKGLGKIDAIDCDAADYFKITNSLIENWDDDAIDIGTSTQEAIVSNNFAQNCDYGLSVGENSVAFAERNVFINNHGGFQSHNGANLTADHNTLFKNDFGIQCFHGGDANSGGNAVVSNTIFSLSQMTDFQIQASSSLEISYSLSDAQQLPGNGNIYDEPNFLDTLSFFLSENSACINAADPSYTLDTNGNFSDIGAFEFNSETSSISEIATSKNYKIYVSNNSLQIESTNYQKIENLSIFNFNGQIIFSSAKEKANHSIPIKEKGVYFCKFKQNNKCFAEKIIY